MMTLTMLIATSWNGWGTAVGTCSVHSWNDGLDRDDGSPPMGMKYQAQLQPDNEPPQERETSRWRRSARLR